MSADRDKDNMNQAGGQGGRTEDDITGGGTTGGSQGGQRQGSDLGPDPGNTSGTPDTRGGEVY